MSKSKTIASTIIALIAWTLLGALLGTAGGYVVYVRQPAVFQSEGAIQIASVVALSETEPEGEVSDADLITSTAVLSRAASQAHLGRLTGITGRSPDDVAQAMQESGNLQVSAAESETAGGPSALGTVYRVQFRGATPSVTQKVVQSIMEATVQSLTEVDNTADWTESVRVLTNVRQEIEQRKTTLEDQLSQLAAPGDVAMFDGELTSLESQRYKRIRMDAEQLQELRNALAQKLRYVESMIQNGASTDAILAGLDIPIMPAVTKQGQPAGTPGDGGQSAERQRRLAERLRVEREIQSAMRPLQQEVDKLLERFGANHPTVAFKQKQIDELQAKLDRLPPLLDNTSSATPSQQSPSGDLGEEQASDAAKRVMASLRALRSEKQQVDEELSQISKQLDEAAKELAEQENLEAERSRLTGELTAQNELLEQAASRLKQLSSRPPFPKTRAAVLRRPSVGVQVAPELEPLLIRGAQIGLVVGLVLVSLLYLTSLATSDAN